MLLPPPNLSENDLGEGGGSPKLNFHYFYSDTIPNILPTLPLQAESRDNVKIVLGRLGGVLREVCGMLSYLYHSIERAKPGRGRFGPLKYFISTLFMDPPLSAL